MADSISLDQLTPMYHPIFDAYTYTFETPVTAPNHSPGGNTGAGEAEAVSFVNTATGEVLNFYDIGGGTTTIEALGGPATSAILTNITTSQGGHSIQFDPFGGRIDHETSATRSRCRVLLRAPASKQKPATR